VSIRFQLETVTASNDFSGSFWPGAVVDDRQFRLWIHSSLHDDNVRPQVTAARSGWDA
jgi:hypothetical protein